jgi:hypothetical protein
MQKKISKIALLFLVTFRFIQLVIAVVCSNIKKILKYAAVMF